MIIINHSNVERTQIEIKVKNTFQLALIQLYLTLSSK